VFYVTEKSLKSDGNRKVRKEIDRLHYSSGTGVSQNIKILDMIDNIPSMALYNREFTKVYIKEKLSLLDILDKGDSYIRNKAYKIIRNIEIML